MTAVSWGRPRLNGCISLIELSKLVRSLCTERRLACHTLVDDRSNAPQVGLGIVWLRHDHLRSLPVKPQTKYYIHIHIHTYTHTHTRLTALSSGLPRWAGTRKVKPICILLKQETVSGSGISWATCKSAPRSRQITMPAPHHSSFLQAGCPSRRPTNSVKALKAQTKYQ